VLIEVALRPERLIIARRARSIGPDTPSSRCESSATPESCACTVPGPGPASKACRSHGARTAHGPIESCARHQFYRLRVG
jgi:hypothetical protein